MLVTDRRTDNTITVCLGSSTLGLIIFSVHKSLFVPYKLNITQYLSAACDIQNKLYFHGKDWPDFVDMFSFQ